MALMLFQTEALLNLMINTANGASGPVFVTAVGIGIQHAGMVIVADGTPGMDERLRRVLNSDPEWGLRPL